MRKLSIVAGMMAAVVLQACSGSARTIIGTPPPPTGTGATVATVTVSSSTAQIAADGSTSATITATAKDANNNLVQGALVAFSSNAGGLAITQGTTDVNGIATATLAAGTASVGTSITVKATTGGISGSVVVTVEAIQQTITLITDLPQIPANGSQAAKITALVRNATNNVVAGVAVTFTSTSGGLFVTQGTTDASGTATATLSAAGDPSTRAITVTATAGATSASLSLNVSGATLTVSGPPSLTLNAQAAYTVFLLDAANTGNPIPNATVTLTSQDGNTLTPATVTTDSTGKGTFTVTASKAGTANSDKITATALNVTGIQIIAISPDSLVFISPPSTSASTNVSTSTLKPITVQWTPSSGTKSGQVITFATTRGTLSSTTAITDATGSATVNISSTVAGPATVTASTPTTPTVPGLTAQTQLVFIATDPTAIEVQASPATIAPFEQSTITAVVRDPTNNLVEGQRVVFSTPGDTTGGTLSPAFAITDVQGRAQTVYTATMTTSASNGVTVLATVQGTTPAVQGTTTLTVAGQAVGLRLGTGSTLTELPAGCGASGTLCTEFEVPYVVLVSDAAGHPVADVPVTLTLHALDYIKGFYDPNTTPYYTQRPSTPQACLNEDDSQSAISGANFNAVLDPGEDGCANGTTVPSPYTCNPTGNQNGQLDPGVTAVASPGTQKTDSTGSATFNIIYPESIATWVDVQIIASTTVSGTEATGTLTFNLPIKLDYLKPPATNPASNSPYGFANACNVSN